MSTLSLIEDVLRTAKKSLAVGEIVSMLDSKHSRVISKTEVNQLLYKHKDKFVSDEKQGAVPLWRLQLSHVIEACAGLAAKRPTLKTKDVEIFVCAGFPESEAFLSGVIDLLVSLNLHSSSFTFDSKTVEGQKAKDLLVERYIADDTKALAKTCLSSLDAKDNESE